MANDDLRAQAEALEKRIKDGHPGRHRARQYTLGKLFTIWQTTIFVLKLRPWKSGLRMGTQAVTELGNYPWDGCSLGVFYR